MKNKSQINAEFKDYVERILRKYTSAVYKVEYPGGEMRSSIDFIATIGDEKVILVKTSISIDDISREEMEELRAMARCLNASPLIIGLYDKHGELEDDVVYDKQGVYAVTPSALINLLRGDEGMIIVSKKGSFFASIDGKKLRSMREEKSLSLGEVADQVGVTRKAIYEYEREKLDVSIEAASRLVDMFGEEILKPINPLINPLTENYKGIGTKPDDPAEVIIINELKDKGDAAHSKRAPIDLSVRIGFRKAGIVVKHRRDHKKLLSRAEELSGISRVINIHGFILVDENIENNLRRDLEDLNMIILEKKRYREILENLKESRGKRSNI